MSLPPSHLAVACSGFEARFGRPATVLVSVPGRVNLLGEHTDYEGGLVLPMAISRRTLLLAAPSEGGQVRMASLAFDDGVHALTDGDGEPLAIGAPTGAASSAADDAPARPASPALPALPAWTVRPRALLAVLRDAGMALRPADVLLAGDLPPGAGLASSAALGVGLCRVAELQHRRDFSPLERSRIVQRAEHAAGTPSGLMDPLVISAANADHALLLDCARESYRQVPLPNGVCALVLDSGARHDLSDGTYARLRAECARAAAFLGVRCLSEVRADALAAGMARLDDVHLCRVRHVVSENARVRAAARAMGEGDFASLNALLRAGHASLRDDVGASVEAVERLRVIVDTLADELPRSLTGARLTGGGFGGSLVALVRRRRADEVLATITERTRVELGAPVDAFVTDAAGPVEVLEI